MLQDNEQPVKPKLTDKLFSAQQKKQIRILFVVFVVLIILVTAFLLFIFRFDNSSSSPIDANNNSQTSATTSDESDNMSTEIAREEVDIIVSLDGAKEVLKGTSLVAESGQVINEEGVVVKNEAVPMTPDAPRLSAPLNPVSLPNSVIKLEATSSGFKPDNFTVLAGQPITLALTSTGVDSRLVFSDSSLAALEIPVPSGFTMAKTFNAPAVPGEYTFFQDISGRNNEVGKMIVK